MGWEEGGGCCDTKNKMDAVSVHNIRLPGLEWIWTSRVPKYDSRPENYTARLLSWFLLMIVGSGDPAVCVQRVCYIVQYCK